MTSLRNRLRRTPLTPPSAPPLLTRHLSLIEDGLREAVGDRESKLFGMLRYHLGWVDPDGKAAKYDRGKAFRPALCVFTATALGGRPEAALPAAVALELIHNYSLIHDDIQDGDRERRKRATVWAIWGEAEALTAGDAMKAVSDLCTHSLRDAGVRLGNAMQIERILTERCLEMIEGQVMDVTFERRLNVNVDEYLIMISRKTGALISSAMEMGALAANPNAAAVEHLAQCGRYLGLTFQLRDDVLGVWGDSNKLGKPIGADIRRRKKAFPTLYALEHATGAAADILQRLYSSTEEMNDEDVDHVLSVMDAVGAREAAQELAEEQCEKALLEADQVALESWARTELEDLAGFLLRRES
jgi:geranylgeranyl diphosphate synthase type I